MKPIAYAFWAAAAALVPVQALRCECGFFNGVGWEYSSGATRLTCRALGGLMEDILWPRCIYDGSEDDWKAECVRVDLVGDSSSGSCDSDED
ncbi:hypothetical protein Cob_v003804 [Colletotrichum orbiculare MAFF 240422]|uniref:Secreted protein n=1 Tax=Colletotrichum orbiculare (strain 104-T / ATCC 96160 / CBS 514.97 / LARS 414 / MAFF 240422) TaxID=1213857 RepID=A0A484FXE1_COLOR|nr:hypothetical protein Cob_v003804 [Colletotrichum orbiculare MAFF 240422]